MSTSGSHTRCSPDVPHSPRKGDIFTLGFGPDAMTCDVTMVKGKTVKYSVRKDGSKNEFEIGSPAHLLAKFWTMKTKSITEKTEKKLWQKMSMYCRHRDYCGKPMCHWSFRDMRAGFRCSFGCCPILHGEDA